MSHLKMQTLPIYSQILPCRDVSPVLTKEQTILWLRVFVLKPDYLNWTLSFCYLLVVLPEDSHLPSLFLVLQF